LYEHGPVSITFEVVNGFRDYKTGVYVSDVCKNTPLDVNHAVLAVGYGTENGVDYWIVKNSWGVEWGDEGFFKIQRGVNMCGVAVCNSFPNEVVKLNQESNKIAFLQ
jgi:cathepsin H